MHSEDWHCIDYLSSVDTCTWLIRLDCAHAAIIITSVCLLCINMIFFWYTGGLGGVGTQIGEVRERL